MLLYRESTREVSGQAAKQALLAAMRRLDRDPIGDCALEALLRAGELECALADLGHPGESAAASVTDAMASHVLVDNGASLRATERALRGLDLPRQLHFRTPEGYSQHGLDPRQFAALAESLDPALLDRPIAIVGVRSIGTSLSAIVSETLRLRGATVQRITVRPNGHPWARVLRLERAEAAFVESLRAQGATFLIVDEGPYASGSTFLCVAETLERAGVPRHSLVLCASRTPDPSRLLAKAAEERWARYRCVSAAPWTPVPGAEDLSAGQWRARVYGTDASAWPACWTQLERVKRRTADGLWLDKFEGFSPYRDAPFERACALAQSGYAPSPTWLGHGFVRYPWLAGSPARASDLDAHALREMARYCAFRSRAFRATDVDPEPLQRMLQMNVDEVFGFDLGERVRFEVAVPIIPDARMQPFEWRVSPQGKWIKTDGHSHGDGPLLPGPTDVCWDLAGAIVEWNMNAGQRDMLLHDYSRLAGDRPHERLPAYILGYCAARLAETFIAGCTAEHAERARLRVAHETYRDYLAQCFGRAPNPPSEAKPAPRKRAVTRAYAPNAA